MKFTKRALTGWFGWPAVLLMLAGGVLAAEASRVNLSQGYKTTEAAAAGALVELDRSAPNTVHLASSEHPDDLVGVVVQTAESLLSVSSSAGSEVQVATSGIANAIVSDVNGPIKQGDRIISSPIGGVGMKATASGRVLGIAQANLESSADKRTIQMKTKDGKTQSVVVGSVSVLVDVNYFAISESRAASFIPPAIQTLSDSIGSKHVSPLRVITGFLLLLLSLVIVVAIVYSAVRSSIISIGRNPLSQPAVRRSLVQVFSLAALILLVTLISVYFILSR